MTSSREASFTRMLSNLQKAMDRVAEHPQPVRKKITTTGERRYLQLKVTLKHISPPIWRRFVVPRDFTLAILHECLQIIMGWDDDHLYEFIVGGRRGGKHYSVPMDDFMGGFGDFDDENAEDYDLSFLTRKGMKFTYIYDFGDSWDHELVAENVNYEHSATDPPVVVLAGQRNCPPEDCGGTWGYADIIEALAANDEGETDSEQEELLHWVGEYDPDQFDLDEINAALANMFGMPKPSKKGTKKGGKKSAKKTSGKK